jgi:hypothetical protein
MLFMRNLAIGAALVLALAVGATLVRDRVPDPRFSTVEEFRGTCASLAHDQLALRSNQQRQAFAICRDVELVQYIATLIKSADSGAFGSAVPEDVRKKIIRAKLSHIRDELRKVRAVLESTKLGPGEGVLIRPALWQIDLDSDGTIQTWEKFFFAIPLRSGDPMRVSQPSNDDEYYRSNYNLSAQIRVDGTDIAWALSYHYFAESLIETILAYTITHQSGFNVEIALVDPEAMERARTLLIKGLQTSERARQLVQSETDNDKEWIANERQTDSVFPIALDNKDFEIWGGLLGHLIPLFQGNTVLPSGSGARGILGYIATACPDGQGLNLAKFYEHPPLTLREMESGDVIKHMCQVIDPTHPASGLMPFISDYSQRIDRDNGNSMQYLKSMLWVN